MKPTKSVDVIDLFDLGTEIEKPMDLEPVTGWQSVGFCGICCKDAEALQPGGRSPRHTESKTPLCRKGI